jgi:hypothetical protein
MKVAGDHGGALHCVSAASIAASLTTRRSLVGGIRLNQQRQINFIEWMGTKSHEIPERCRNPVG